MVKIRLARRGAKRRPFYHILVTDSRSRRDGCAIEQIGFFNPLATKNEVALKMDAERITYWLDQGAKATERVTHLIKKYNKEHQLEA